MVAKNEEEAKQVKNRAEGVMTIFANCKTLKELESSFTSSLFCSSSVATTFIDIIVCNSFTFGVPSKVSFAKIRITRSQKTIERSELSMLDLSSMRFEQIEAIMVVLKKTYYGADLQRLITALRRALARLTHLLINQH